MLVSTTVVSTRILAPGLKPFSLAMLTIRVDLLDRLGSHGHAPSSHGLGVGHLGHSDAGELAVDEIGPHLPLEYGIAPIASVLENQEPHDDFGGIAVPTRVRLKRWRLANAS